MKRAIDAVVAFLLPAWARDHVMGDLDEEFNRRAAQLGRRAALRWYAREAAAISTRYAAERWRRSPDNHGPVTSRREHLMADLRQALRSLSRSPGFAAVAIFTLALGIAANVSIYALIDAVLFRPISTFEPERMVRLGAMRRSNEPGTRFAITYADYHDIHSLSTALTDVTATTLTPFVLRSDQANDEILGEVVTGSYFPLLHAATARGRLLGVHDDATGAPAVAVISERASERHFAGRTALGATIHLNNRPFTVVGIAPRTLGGTFIGVPIDAWVSTAASDGLFAADWRTSRRSDTRFNLFARLAPGVTRDQAGAELDLVAREIGRKDPATRGDLQLRVSDGGLLVGAQRRSAAAFAVVLAIMVGLVLLMVCANVANLFLARGMSLRRQMAIRLALGASRWRLISLVMTESLVLSILAGLAALGIATGVMRTLSTFAPLPTLMIDLGLRMTATTVVAAGLLAIVTGLLLGIMPALHASNPAVQAILRDDSRTMTGGRRMTRVRAALVVAQVAVSVLLLSSAGLFLRSLLNAQDLDLGFAPQHAMAIDIDLGAKNLGAADAHRLYAELHQRLRTRADIAAVAFSNRAPVDLSTPTVGVILGGRPLAANEQAPQATMYLASPEYFDAIGLPMLQGRMFTAADTLGAPAVAVVNRSMAARFWPGTQAIGRTFRTVPDGPDILVVGIARDSRYRSLGEEPGPHVYLPFAQSDGQSATLIVRPLADPRAFLAPVQSELQRLTTPLEGFFGRTLNDHLKVYRLPSQLAATLSGVLSLVAMSIAAVGLYGLIAYMVGQRAPELAIRLALGADPGQIRSLVLASGLRLFVPGLLLGVFGGVMVGVFASSLLYGVGPVEPLSMCAAAALVGVVVLVASYLPARRAMRIDPAGLLRS